jgi:hypothetical protein
MPVARDADVEFADPEMVRGADAPCELYEEEDEPWEVCLLGCCCVDEEEERDCGDCCRKAEMKVERKKGRWEGMMGKLGPSVDGNKPCFAFKLMRQVRRPSNNDVV